MKKIDIPSFMVAGLLVFVLLMVNICATAQDTLKVGSSLPDSVNKIVTFSCVPCHTSDGGLMSRSKLNFTEWDKYSPEKQKEKAAKMYSELSKGAMPPKTAREKRPEIIPTKEQVEIIKNWSESFPSVSK